MRKRAEGLSWIDKGNSAQVQWAADYLRAKGKLSRGADVFGVNDYETLMREGLDLEKSADGVLTLLKMQAAWRQRKYRQPHHARKPYTFTLPIQTKRHLTVQAEACGHTETEHLIHLIEQGHEEAIRHSKRMKESQAKARKDLPKAKAEVAFWKLRDRELTKLLSESLRARFTAESVPAEELEQRVEREMNRIRHEVWGLADEQVKNNPLLKHLGI